ncbi:LsmAD domain [Macleaya cordata]|uniref:LsmAD domain n=1 Tax=Macleaya cordata TaxID=56857 RepID=A0A200QD11_MACCD|nr:LsmAD domain [Macleaya cordata]
MSLQQVAQPKPSANGFGRRRVERDAGTRLGSNFPSGKQNPGMVSGGGLLNGSKEGGHEGPSRDRLVYLATCLIGHRVEVQVKNGSIFSGIFHAMNAENDFGIILKMASLTKDTSFRGQKPASDSVSKAPSKTLIIPAKELVQVIAKDVSVSGDGLKNGAQRERRQDIMIDSYISKSHFGDAERELARWTPDEDDLQCPELENIFDGTWNRLNWDQFETNEALFGVKSTFDEELYTTKLERGPQTRELEREALRIAREIEGEDTKDLHLAEERGLHLHEDLDIDEETRFSSVLRTVDDSGYEENEDIVLDSRNTETFGSSSDSATRRSFSDVARGKSDNVAQASSSSSSVDEAYSQLNAGRDQYFSGSGDHARQLDGDSRMNENQCREQDGGKNGVKELMERKTVNEEAQTSKFEGSRKAQAATQPVNPRGRPGSSASSTSECAGATSALIRPSLSPSSSIGSLSSEKSTLNPYAKEFKLNPNAKSFTPSQTPLRPPSPVSDGSYYFPNNLSAVPHMHGLPVGIGIGTSYAGPQPVIYSPQAAPIQQSQTFIHPNGHLYGQQMILGHPRQVLYMPNYPPEMPYKGRDF